MGVEGMRETVTKEKVAKETLSHLHGIGIRVGVMGGVVMVGTYGDRGVFRPLHPTDARGLAQLILAASDVAASEGPANGGAVSEARP